MRCEEILDRLVLSRGDLEKDPTIAEHVKNCPACHQDVPGLISAVKAVRQASTFSLLGHLTSEQVVAFALDPKRARAEWEGSGADHASDCPTCKVEIEEVRRAEQARLPLAVTEALGPQKERRFWEGWLGNPLAQSPAAKVAFASILAAVVLAYPAYLGLYKMPQFESQVSALQVEKERVAAEASDLKASVQQAEDRLKKLTNLREPLHRYSFASPVRGQTSRQTVEVFPGQPFILLAVRPLLGAAVLDPDVYRLEVRSAGDQTVWAVELTAEQVRRNMLSSGELDFLIPASALRSGSYQLRVLPGAEPARPLLEIPFEVVTAG